MTTEGEQRSVGLDVVRSIAILLVLVSHYGIYFAAWYGVALPMKLVVGGFFGVELFFALSGFLIGRLLIEILDSGISAHQWLVFMMRRWMRTLPLYYVCLIFLALFWSPEFWHAGGSGLGRDLPWFLTMTQNLAWRVPDDWFAVSWSLAVEEWFYLLFSVLLFAAAMVAGRRTAFWSTVLIFLLIPPALRWCLPAGVDFEQVTSKAVVYRLDAIAAGVLVAWLQLRRAKFMRHPGLLLAAGMFLIIFFWSGALDMLLHPPLRVRRTFLFDVESFGWALCLPAAASTAWHSPRWLAAGARALSNQSYAIYLIHLTVVEIFGYYRRPLHLAPPAAIIAVLVAVFGLSYLSFRFLERPILALRPTGK